MEVRLLWEKNMEIFSLLKIEVFHWSFLFHRSNKSQKMRPLKKKKKYMKRIKSHEKYFQSWARKSRINGHASKETLLEVRSIELWKLWKKRKAQLKTAVRLIIDQLNPIGSERNLIKSWYILTSTSMTW